MTTKEFEQRQEEKLEEIKKHMAVDTAYIKLINELIHSAEWDYNYHLEEICKKYGLDSKDKFVSITIDHSTEYYDSYHTPRMNAASKLVQQLGMLKEDVLKGALVNG